MSRLSVSDCFGCHEVICLVGVNPGEDNTIPYRVERLPPGHTIMIQRADRVRIKCPKGVASWVRWDSPNIDPGTIKAAKALCPEDAVEHETWMEYHDRLIREYYDVEAEWALIKEICPELDRPEPVAKPVRARRRLPPYHGVAAGFGMTAAMNLMIGATWVAIIWFTLTLAMLTVANMHTRR
jgi:hypothetical protein